MNPTEQNNNLPPLPSLDSRITIAPKDDLIPVTPSTEADQTKEPENQTNKQESSNFTPPASWGDHQQEPLLEEENQTKNSHKEDTPLTRFVKVFLIAVALILLGVLIGIIASKFLVNTDIQQYQVYETTPTPSLTITSESEFNENKDESASISHAVNKTFSYRNNSSGPISFDLTYMDNWSLATKSADKNDLNFSLVNKDLIFSIFYNPNDKNTVPKLCLTTEDISPKGLPHLRYSFSKDATVSGFNWRIINNQESTTSSIFKICEQNKENQYQTLTSIGYIDIKQSKNHQELSIQEQDFLIELLKGLNILSSTTSANLQ